MLCDTSELTRTMQWETFEQDLHRRGWQMSSNERPRAERQNTHPALSDAIIGIPVTPTISNEDNKFPSFHDHHHDLPQELPPHILESIGAKGASEYGNGADTNGSATGEELLRRLSFAASGQSSDGQPFDPRAAHPDLHLSGNVISAAFCVPYKIGYTTTGEWVGYT